MSHATVDGRSPQRLMPGGVRDAIIDYLATRQKPAELREIYDGVESRLQRRVAGSSVRSYLQLNEGSVFERTGRGQYMLVDIYEPERVYEPNRLETFEPAFAVGSATMYCADSLRWLRTQSDCSIHGVVTDPPYGLVEYSSEQKDKLRSGKGGIWRIPPAYDGHVRSPVPRFTVLSNADLKALGVFFTKFAAALIPKLVPGAHVFIASNPLLSYIVSNAVVSTGLERRGEVVRLVMTMRGGDRPKNAHVEFPGVTVMPRSMWEPWLVFRKPLDGRVQDNLRRWGTGGLRRPSDTQPFGDVIASHPARPSERRLAPHPSLKPQAFLRQIVRAVLPMEHGVVLDPFAGSGSTLAAAEHLGMQSIGVESDDQYVQMARRSIPALASLD